MHETDGTLDYRDECFIVSSGIDPRVHAQLRVLPGQRYEGGVWLVPRLLRTARPLVGLARRQGWRITVRAQHEIDALAEEDASAEFYVQLVQGAGGEPLFKCRADDDDLDERLAAIPGAEADDEPNTWIIPCDRAEACEALRALVEEDERFECDRASERQLFEAERWVEASRTEPRAAAIEPVMRRSVDEPARADAVDAVDAFEREQELLALSRAVIADADEVSSHRGLYPYQHAGVRYLQKARRAFLADDKGLGKSAQALRAIETSGAYPALVICPEPLELSWQSEVGRWLEGARSCAIASESAGAIPDADVVVVHYELLYRLRHALKAKRFRAIVADDSSQLSNERSLKTRAALELAEGVEYRFCLSSKVLSEQPILLLPQLTFLGRIDDLQGRAAFVDRYCGPRHDVGGTRYRATHVEELEQRLRACCLCRRERKQLRAQLPSPARFEQPVRSLAAYDEAALELELRDRLSALQAAFPSAEAHAQAHDLIEAELARASLRKVDGVAKWIEHFLSSGELLAVLLREPALVDELARRFPEAAVVRANGQIVMGGATLEHPYLVATASLVFIEHGAVGPALRLLRGRHVAIAQLTIERSCRGTAEALVEDKSGDWTGAEWYLIGDAPVESAAMRVLGPRALARTAGEEVERIVAELLEPTGQVGIRQVAGRLGSTAAR